MDSSALRTDDGYLTKLLDCIRGWSRSTVCLNINADFLLEVTGISWVILSGEQLSFSKHFVKKKIYIYIEIHVWVLTIEQQMGKKMKGRWEVEY